MATSERGEGLAPSHTRTHIHKHTYTHTHTHTQGYSGCAVGKARQAAKTELEKLKVSAAL